MKQEHKRPTVNVMVERDSTLTFTSDLPCIGFILFTRIKSKCARTRQWKPPSPSDETEDYSWSKCSSDGKTEGMKTKAYVLLRHHLAKKYYNSLI